MIVERSNFYMVAGGPGSGKTALIEALRAQGQLCVDECIRKIIRQEVKIGGDGLDRKDQTLFQELILSWSIEAFESVSEGVRPVFFDRGIPELLGDERPAALNTFSGLPSSSATTAKCSWRRHGNRSIAPIGNAMEISTTQSRRIARLSMPTSSAATP